MKITLSLKKEKNNNFSRIYKVHIYLILVKKLYDKAMITHSITTALHTVNDTLFCFFYLLYHHF